MKRKTIIHFIDSLGWGDAEVQLSNTLLLLPQYDHVLITLNPPHNQLPDLEPHLKAHHYLDIKSRKQWPRVIFTLRRLIKQYSPLLLHLHSQNTGLLGKIACPRSTPLFYTIHNPYSIDAFAANRLALFAEKITARPYHHLIGVSEYVLRDYQQHVPRSGSGDVLYNMVGAEFFEAPAPPDYTPGTPLRCVSVGNLKQQKNYRYSLEAFSLIRHLPITLDIYGGGPDQEMIEHYIRDNDLRNVTLKGKLGGISQRLAGYHAYVISSSYEGFGIAPLEAMAAGLPALVSDIPVFREVAGEAVLYFDVSRPAALAQKLESIYKGKCRLPPYASKGRARARSISYKDEYISNLLRVYDKYTPQ